jgi:hypothetical protein
VSSDTIIFARREEIATQQVVFIRFALQVNEFLTEFAPLQDLTSCDDNLDGNVLFDLDNFSG